MIWESVLKYIEYCICRWNDKKIVFGYCNINCNLILLKVVFWCFELLVLLFYMIRENEGFVIFFWYNYYRLLIKIVDFFVIILDYVIKVLVIFILVLLYFNVYYDYFVVGGVVYWRIGYG